MLISSFLFGLGPRNPFLDITLAPFPPRDALSQLDPPPPPKNAIFLVDVADEDFDAEDVDMDAEEGVEEEE